MKSMLVIGAGRFGSNLAVKLHELGNEVMVVDQNEAVVDKLASDVTMVQIGNCMDKDVLRELGVRNFDVCFVCISDNFQSSMIITSLLKEMGARIVVAKSDRSINSVLLGKIGADVVVYPERDMAQRTAARFSAGAFDYIELSPEYAIMEINVPESWKGHDLAELHIRSKNQINVIGVRRNNEVTPILSADHVFGGDEHIIVAGARKDILKLMKK